MKYERVDFEVDWIASLPVREVWIEISGSAKAKCIVASLPVREVWIEIPKMNYLTRGGARHFP